MKRVLFVCSRNRRRSPTAERVFAGWPGIETASVGLAPDAEEVLTAEALDDVDLVLVMERAHRARLQRRFGACLKRARVVCLDIADDYAFMDPALVALLEARAGPHLARLTGGPMLRRAWGAGKAGGLNGPLDFDALRAGARARLSSARAKADDAG